MMRIVFAACSFRRHPVYSLKFVGAGSCVSRDLQEKITFRVYLVRQTKGMTLRITASGCHTKMVVHLESVSFSGCISSFCCSRIVRDVCGTIDGRSGGLTDVGWVTRVWGLKRSGAEEYPRSRV